MGLQIVNREAFLQQLELLEPGLASREIAEQSTCFIFHEGRAYTFNDEVACSINLNLPTGTIAGAVQAKPLLDVLRKIPDETIKIEVKDNHVTVRGKRKRAGVKVDAEILLDLEAVETPKKWKSLPAAFAEAVDLVRECCGTNEEEWALTCIQLTSTHLEACDRFQAARYELDLPIRSSCLIRRSSLQPITGLGMSQYAEGKNWFHFQNPKGLVMSCRRHSGEFPDITEILAVKGRKITLPKALIEATERAEIFSNNKTNDSDAITVALTAGLLTIKGEGALGWYQETKKIKYSGSEISFLMAPKILREIVRQHNDCEITNERLKVSTGAFSYVASLEGGARDE